MPYGNFLNCATCHNFRPSLTITMNDGNEYFEKENLCSNFFIMPHVRF